MSDSAELDTPVLDRSLRRRRRRRLNPLLKWLAAALLGIVVIALLAFHFAGQWLVVDQPRQSDAILLIDQQDASVARAIQLWKSGMAPRVLVYARADRKLYGRAEAELANEFVRSRLAGLPATLCPVGSAASSPQGFTLTHCFDVANARSLLVVAPALESRRLLQVYRRYMPGFTWSVASAEDPTLRPHSLMNRQWVKAVVGGYQTLLWWELVDRWKEW